MIRRSVRLELEKRDQSQRERNRLATLAEKSFYYLSEEEMRRMKEAVAKLAQRLKNVVAIRHRKAKRGKFDVKGTLRKNLQYGGVPFKIQFDRRMRDKPQVVVLCDVSDSVRNVSRFMLQFVYSLQDLYSRVRSFIFVSEIGEITQLFEENDTQDAIEQALTGNLINVFAHSDFGRAFRAFHRDHLAAVNNRTTVIVLGDARNNYNLPQEWVLRDIAPTRQAVDLAQPGEPSHLGLRRQRDGPLSAVLPRGRGMPEPEPALSRDRSPRLLTTGDAGAGWRTASDVLRTHSDGGVVP